MPWGTTACWPCGEWVAIRRTQKFAWPFSAEEASHEAPDISDWPRAVRLDFPGWLEPELSRSLGHDLEPVMRALQDRARVFLRVNLSRGDREAARACLLEDGIESVPNALAPIINVIALNLAYLVTGVVVVEVVFVYPGLGQLMVDAVSNRDIAVVQAVALIFAAAYVALNLIADVLSTITNPRLMHRR